jgi:hypothetical protein
LLVDGSLRSGYGKIHPFHRATAAGLTPPTTMPGCRPSHGGGGF